MAVLSGATASGQVLVTTSPTTTRSTYYTAPAVNSNVTGSSATAYIKEIVICNWGGSAGTINLWVGGASIISGLSVNANDTKILSGLNTMISGGGLIEASVGSGSSLQLYISGVVVQ